MQRNPNVGVSIVEPIFAASVSTTAPSFDVLYGRRETIGESKGFACATFGSNRIGNFAKVSIQLISIHHFVICH
jgi:hypothetical protein